MFDELVADLYEYIELLSYKPETETTRGVIAKELELIIGRRFSTNNAMELHKKLCACRRKMNNSKINV